MANKKISMDELIARIKAHPNFAKAGMILCHNGVVRGVDRAGAKGVQKLHVEVVPEKIGEILSWGETLPGVVAVLAEALEGELNVGDDVLYVVVAGDIRENVLDAMRQILDRLKSEGFRKREVYLD